MSKSQQHPLNSGNAATNLPKKKQHKPLTGWKRQAALLSRWLHIYLSMVSFAVLLFFAVTGLTLNHAAEWGGEVRTKVEKGKLNSSWVNRADTNTIAKLEVVEFFRKKYRIKGDVAEFRTDDRECSVSFKGPGYSADAFITRESGAYELSESRTGLIGIMNDLHKGRDSGKGWSIVIDISAILMTLVSLSGIILILFVRKRRFSGLVLALIGSAIAYLVYLCWVP
jgi:hypothetical protein